MKQCRFCDADIPYYGCDECISCRIKAEVKYWAEKNSKPNTVSECAREDLENNL